MWEQGNLEIDFYDIAARKSDGEILCEKLNNLQELKDAIERGLNLTSNFNGKPAILHAIERGLTKAFIVLLKEMNHPIGIRDEDGVGLCHYLIKYGVKSKTIKKIYEKYGWDYVTKDKDGNTTTHLAIKHGRVDLLKLFLREAEVDFSNANYEGESVKYLMTNSRNQEIKKIAHDIFLDVSLNYVPTSNKFAVLSDSPSYRETEQAEFYKKIEPAIIGEDSEREFSDAEGEGF